MNLENKNLNRGLTTGPHPSVGGSPAQLPCFTRAGTMAMATAGTTAVAGRRRRGLARPQPGQPGVAGAGRSRGGRGEAHGGARRPAVTQGRGVRRHGVPAQPWPASGGGGVLPRPGGLGGPGLAAALRECVQSVPATATARRSRWRDVFPAVATWGLSGERAGEHESVAWMLTVHSIWTEEGRR